MRKLKLEELERPSLAEYQKISKIPVVVVLDNVRSAMNVGSFFRTCDAFGVQEICLVGITACPPNREITKTAIGATESVKWSYHQDIDACIKKLRSEEFTIVGIEQTNESKTLDTLVLNAQQTYALVFGNEVDGVSEAAISLLDTCIEIPQMGIKHSLNVSVCGGVVLWEFFKFFK